jgi:hypothetical protein
MSISDWDHVLGCINQVEKVGAVVGAVITHITCRTENSGLSNAICIDFMEPNKEAPTLFTYECYRKPDDCYNTLGNILDILEEQYGYKIDPTVRRRLFK